MNLYGVFWTPPDGRAKWALGTNREEALHLAAALHPLPVEVYAHDGPKDNWRGSWDAPTFRATASRRLR